MIPGDSWYSDYVCKKSVIYCMRVACVCTDDGLGTDKMLSPVHVTDSTVTFTFYSMAWQKTFTLSRKRKGCHLVTEEIVSHIQPGLLGVEASLDKAGKIHCWPIFRRECYFSLCRLETARKSLRFSSMSQSAYISCSDSEWKLGHWYSAFLSDTDAIIWCHLKMSEEVHFTFTWNSIRLHSQVVKIWTWPWIISYQRVWTGDTQMRVQSRHSLSLLYLIFSDASWPVTRELCNLVS